MEYVAGISASCTSEHKPAIGNRRIYVGRFRLFDWCLATRAECLIATNSINVPGYCRRYGWCKSGVDNAVCRCIVRGVCRAGCGWGLLCVGCGKAGWGCLDCLANAVGFLVGRCCARKVARCVNEVSGLGLAYASGFLRGFDRGVVARRFVRSVRLPC